MITQCMDWQLLHTSLLPALDTTPPQPAALTIAGQALYYPHFDCVEEF